MESENEKKIGNSDTPIIKDRKILPQNRILTEPP